MANLWLQHVKNTKTLNPKLMKSGGLKAVIMEAKKSYNAFKKQKGGSCGQESMESLVDNAEPVVGEVGRTPMGNTVENNHEGYTEPFKMDGGKMRKVKKSSKSTNKSQKKGGKKMKKVMKKTMKKTMKKMKKMKRTMKKRGKK